MNYLKSIAMFIVCIILALPIYTADVFAVNQLVITKHSGSDNIEGFLKQTSDKAIFEVTANVDNDAELTADQVKVNGFDFVSCTPGTGNYQCKFESPQYSVITPDTYPYTIELFTDAGEVIDMSIHRSVQIEDILAEQA